MLETNLVKAYSLIFNSYCTKAMQARIQECPTYEDIIDDPLKLLVAIAELMHATVRGQYPTLTYIEAVNRVFQAKQKEGEDLLDYTKRFKQLRDVMKSITTDKVTDFWVEETPEY